MSIKLAMELIFAGIEDGGGTFDSRGNTVTKDIPFPEAYVVGGRYPALVIRLPKDRGIIAATEQVAAWIDSCRHTIYFGSWVDDGNLYIDAVDIIANRELAIDFGINRGQIAIWDLKKGEEIRLGQRGDE